jgi:hypothetical protein
MMAVDPELLAKLRQMQEDNPDPDTSELAPLTSTAMVIAYWVALARDGDLDEVAVVETALVDLRLDRETLKSDATLLNRLGYRDIGALLKRLARKAKLRPPTRLASGRLQHIS